MGVTAWWASALGDYYTNAMATLVLLKGQAGVGKTTLARDLQGALGWQYIVRDDIKEALVRAGCPESELGKQSYDRLWGQLEDSLSEGISVISDTNLNQPIALKHIEDMVAKTRAKVVVLSCYCDVSIHKTRLEGRKHQGLASFWIDSWDRYQAYLQSDDNHGEFELPYPAIQVDTGQAVDFKVLAQRINSV